MNSLADRPYFDALAVASSARRTLDGVTQSEFHLFTYLGCLLALYDGGDSAAWGYEFAGTPYGIPFSDAVDDATRLLYRRGLLSRVSPYDTYEVTEKGQSEYEALSSFSIYQSRRRYLSTAVDSSLLVPLASIRGALGNDPLVGVKRPLAHRLLTTLGEEHFRQEFEQIRTVLGQSQSDLLGVAVVWLSARSAAVSEHYEQNRAP